MKPKTQQRLGIAFGAAGLEVLELSTNGASQPRVERCQTFPVAPPPVSADGDSEKGGQLPPGGVDLTSVADKLKVFHAPRGTHHASVSVGLGAADVFCRLLSLPSINEAELRPMLELQLENLSPLPPEQVVFGYELLRKGEKQSDLLVAIARRDKVIERLESLRKVGFLTDQLDLDVLALLEWMRQQKVLSLPELAQLALVVLEGDSASLLLVYADQPHLVMSVPLSGLNGTDAEKMNLAVDLIGNELRLAQAAVQSVRPEAVWPVMHVLQRSAAGSVGATIDPAAFAAALSPKIGLKCAVLAEAQKPGSITLGLCLRTFDHGRPHLNLVPQEYVQERQRSDRRRRLKEWAIGAAAIYGLVVLGLGIVFAVRYFTLSGLENEESDLKPAYEKAIRLRDDVQALQEYVNNQNPALEILDELLKLKPEGVFLTDFNFLDGDQVTVTGYAPTVSAATEFDSRLRKSKFFPGGTKMSQITDSAARAHGPAAASSAGSGNKRFSIQCLIKKSQRAEAVRHRPSAARN